MSTSSRHNERERRYSRQLRVIVINHYGGKCACCGEAAREFLAIDHIGGGGSKHRERIGSGGRKFYLWLRRNGYPKGFRVLCHNCNSSLGHYGYCPHGNLNDSEEDKFKVDEPRKNVYQETLF